MAVEEIAPGVHAIGMGYVNAFLIAGEDGLTLVDSGLPKKKDAILRALARLGRQPADLKHILITHHHIDHMGSLRDVMEATGARSYVHPLDSPIVRGDEPQPGPNPKSLLGRFAGPLIERFGPAPTTAAVDIEVADGGELPIAGGITAVHTPGHTPGTWRSCCPATAACCSRATPPRTWSAWASPSACSPSTVSRRRRASGSWRRWSSMSPASGTGVC